MTVASIQNFSGMLPMKDASVIPDNNADYCRNTRLYSGAVEGFTEANLVYTLTKPGTNSVYRIPRSSAVQPDFSSSLWLEFDDPYMAVARAPMIEDQYKRYYFFPSDEALESAGPYYNTYDRLNTGQPSYILGISNPLIAPTLSHSGGTSTAQEVRSYVYTWSSQFSEEGPPSPPAVHQGTVDGKWRVVLSAPTVADTKDRVLTKTNIYRTVTDLTGVAAYYRIASIPISQTVFTDNFVDTQITDNLILPSQAWTRPPADLQGVVVMANGILAGFSNSKEVWFCEAFVPHAWPSAYALTVDAPIVALAAVGSSLVVLTESTPWVFSGVTPASMTGGKIASREPCNSRGSVVPAGEGVYYSSPNGLILVNTMGTSNVTQAFISKEDWSGMGVIDFAASKYSMAYMAFSKASKAKDNGIFIDHLSLSAALPSLPTVLFSWLSFDPVLNVYSDELSGGTFLVTATQVIEWNPATVSGRVPYIWRSKQFRFPFAQQFVGGVVYFDVPPTLDIPVPTAVTRKTSQNQQFDPTTQYLLLKVYADKRLVLVREIQVSGELILFPSGFKATYWQFEFEGQVKIQDVKFATSVKELMLA